MIFRLSQKLNTKLKAGTLSSMPLDQNPFADWSAHLFVAARTQYILVTNSTSLYSVVVYGKGVTDGNIFVQRFLSSLSEFLADDGQQFVYRQFIAPASGSVRFAKAVDRSVTGSMNDMIFHAKACLIEDELSPYEVGFKLNEIPFSSLKYASPKKVFQAMQIARPAQQEEEV